MDEVDGRRRQFLKTSIRAGGALLLGRFVTGCATSGAVARMRRSLVTARGESIDPRFAPENRPYVGVSKPAIGG